MQPNRTKNSKTVAKRVTLEMLTERFGISERYAKRFRSTLVDAGLLAKVGRQFFGDLDAIAAAIMTGKISAI